MGKGERGRRQGGGKGKRMKEGKERQKGMKGKAVEIIKTKGSNEVEKREDN